MLPLSDLLVVTLEQAVAAPMASRRLADAGARVIKLERPEGDFAREYDQVVGGLSAYFVWLNRGKESAVVDLSRPDGRALVDALLARADVFIQNLKPGALARLGYATARLRATHPRLIICSITGYGEDGPYAHRKAYDLLIQAEAGLASVTGSPDAPSRVGVSIVDVATGQQAYEAILEALIARGRTGEGADIHVSMFDSVAELMAVPLLHGQAGKAPRRVGLSHASIAPYGVFETGDGRLILISIQNEREWAAFAAAILAAPELATTPGFASNRERVENRAAVDRRVAAVFARSPAEALIARLEAAEIAFGVVNEVADVLRHPHLRLMPSETAVGAAMVPAPPARIAGRPLPSGAVPRLGAHTVAVRAEFLGTP